MPGTKNLKKNKRERTEKTLKKMVRLAQRDGYECGECLMPITDIDMANIDHVLPLSSGGNGRMCNLQLTHTECNAIKGNRFTANSRIKVEKLKIHYGDEFCNVKEKKTKIEKKVSNEAKLNEFRKPIINSGLKFKKKGKKAVARKVFSVRKEPPQPAELWNEIVQHGLSRLSFEKFKRYFEEYRRYDTIEVTIENQG